MSGSVAYGIGTKQLGSYGFTLVDEPFTYTSLFAKMGDFSFFAKPKWLVGDGSYKGTYANVSVSKELPIFDLTGTATLEFYDAPGYDTWFEPVAGLSREFGPLSASLNASFPLNGSNSSCLSAVLKSSFDLTDKLSIAATNTTSYMLGNYHGIEGMGANTTALSLMYSATDTMDVFATYSHVQSFNSNLETGNGVEVGLKFKW